MTPTQQPVQATSKKHLQRLLAQAIKEHGPNVDCNHIDVSKIKDMACLFDGTDFDGDISRWNTSAVKTMRSMFSDCPFNGDLSNWDTSSVLDTSYMFAKTQMITKQPSFAGDLSKWNTRSIKAMDFMFAYCKGPFRGLEYWDLSNVRSMAGLFMGTSATLDLAGWRMPNVRDVHLMFAYSSGKTGLDAWDVSQVTNMKAMFQKSTNAIDISRWNVGRAMNFQSMFFGSSGAGDISAWDINPEASVYGMLDMHDMQSMDHVSMLHWAHVLENNDASFLEKWPRALEHFNRHAPMLTSLGLPVPVMASWLQKDWLGQQPMPVDSIALPDICM